MALTAELLDVVAAVAERSPGQRLLPWPMPCNLGTFVSFAGFAEWQAFWLRFSLRDGIPLIVTAKFDRAHKLHLLGWIDFDLIKAGELVALTTLELALKDRYGDKVKDKGGNISFAHLLRYLVERDGLTDDKVPMNRRCGPPATVVGRLTGAVRPSLAEIRNDLAHGYPFDGWPQAGLLELVRDLIEYAYRDMIAQQGAPP